MKISIRCSECQALHQIDPVHMVKSFSCTVCYVEIPFSPSESIRKQNLVDSCPYCTKSAFYIQRDFNKNLGLFIVILFALIGLIFVFLDYPLFFYLSLGVGALIDYALYTILPDITVCYNCHTTFRNTEKNPVHTPFDLHIADHYEGRSQG